MALGCLPSGGSVYTFPTCLERFDKGNWFQKLIFSLEVLYTMSDWDGLTAEATPDWLRAMTRLTEEDGDLLPLGDRHWAFFVEQKPVLLVTFEDAGAIREREGNLPAHQALAHSRGWSHLCIISEGETWWRDPAVYRYFDRLVDDGFLEDFERVVFYGAGISGYAAAAYSVASPGAELLLIAPRATMDTSLARWDDRHLAARRLNFTDRYGFAPDMTEGASKVWLIHDPYNMRDAMHAALFRRPYVTVLNAPHTGEATEDTLVEMQVLDRLLAAVMDGKLTPYGFARMWRGRRSNASYLRAILYAAERSGHPQREVMICRSVTSRLRAPRFQRRLAELTGG